MIKLLPTRAVSAIFSFSLCNAACIKYSNLYTFIHLGEVWPARFSLFGSIARTRMYATPLRLLARHAYELGTLALDIEGLILDYVTLYYFVK